MSLSWKLSDVIGRPLSETIQLQLKARKRIVLKNSKGKTAEQLNDELHFLHSNTGWVKVTSSVDIINLEEGQTQPAQKYILLGGAYDQAFGKKFGFTGTGGTSSYSFNNQQGFVPMPGLTNFQVQSKGTYGALRTASFNFTVTSIEEFSILERLYLRPGYTVLLEWGHSIYVGNDDQIVKNIKTFPDFFTGKKLTDIEKTLSELKEDSSGNYDAMVGFIKNFSWTYNGADYVCQVDVISKGELFESSKISVAPSLDDQASEPEGAYYSAETITTDLHKFLSVIKASDSEKFFTEKKEETQEEPVYDPQWGTEDSDLSPGSILEPSPPPPPVDNISALKVTEALEKFCPNLYKTVNQDLEDVGAKLQILRYEVGGPASEKYSRWTRCIDLRTFLCLINNIFTLQDESGDKLVSFFIGNKQDQENKLSTSFLTFPEHILLDPQVGVLPKNSKIKTQLCYHMSKQVEYSSEQQADILNIFISVDYILSIANDKIQSSDTKQGAVVDLVRNVLSGLQSNLGDINEFDIHYEDETAQYYVVDRKVVPSKDDLEFDSDENGIQTPKSFIDVIGLKTMVQDLKITSKLSGNLTTMIAIAAQNKSSASTSADVLGMQKWNFGTKDRHLVNKQVGKVEVPKDTEQEELIGEKDFKKFASYLKSTYTSNVWYIDYNPDDLKGYIPVHQKLMREFTGYTTLLKKQNPHGLIPFELSFTMKGISGIKIGQSFFISEVFLPEQYKGQVGFLVTGVDHSFNNNDWTTSINAKMILAAKEEKEIKPFAEPFVPAATPEPVVEEFTGVSPTDDGEYFSPLGRGMQLRSDSAGSGTYKASRGKRQHLAWDVLAEPGETVYSPIDGTVITSASGWSKGLGFVQVQGTGKYEGQKWRLGYVKPSIASGAKVTKGTPLGTIQDMSPGGAGAGSGYVQARSPMQNHLHIDLKKSSGDFKDVDPAKLNYTLTA